MKTALVVEGGGMRGIYTAGILDAFHQAHFNPFDSYFGVSAGACNLSSFLAGQFQRNYRSYVGHMSQKGFIDWQRGWQGGHWMDLDWLWAVTQRENAIDVSEAMAYLTRTNKAFWMLVTDVVTGQPRPIQPTAANWLDYLKASCAVPFFYRDFCQVEGHLLADGGVSDPLPVAEAYRQGARRIVVLRTKEAGYPKGGGPETRLASWYFRHLPALRQAILRQPRVYRDALAFIEQPPPAVTIWQI